MSNYKYGIQDIQLQAGYTGCPITSTVYMMYKTTCPSKRENVKTTCPSKRDNVKTTCPSKRDNVKDDVSQ